MPQNGNIWVVSIVQHIMSGEIWNRQIPQQNTEPKHNKRQIVWIHRWHSFHFNGGSRECYWFWDIKENSGHLATHLSGTKKNLNLSCLFLYKQKFLILRLILSKGYGFISQVYQEEEFQWSIG